MVPEWQDEALVFAAQNFGMHQEPRLTVDNHLKLLLLSPANRQLRYALRANF